MKAFIVFRDRVSYGKRCRKALRDAGLDVVVADHGSTYPPAVAWLRQLERYGDMPVLRRGPGHHPRDLWSDPAFRELCGDERYIVTDPDVIPSEDCPWDWPQYLSGLLDEYGRAKAGLGLRLDRIPENYQWREKVLGWEAQFWLSQLRDGVYGTVIDTTLAMYRPLAESTGFVIDDAIRTGHPYVADHVSWYEDLDDPTPEQAYYHEHAEPGISFWTLRSKSAWGS